MSAIASCSFCGRSGNSCEFRAAMSFAKSFPNTHLTIGWMKKICEKKANGKFNLNYSRNSVWTDNCAMNLKIDPCSHNTAQLTRQKGIKSLWQSSEQLLSCQGSLIVAIPAVRSAYRYLKVSHRIHSYKGSCYTTWMWYILLNGLLLQQSSAVLNGRYQCAYFACLLITPIV